MICEGGGLTHSPSDVIVEVAQVYWTIPTYDRGAKDCVHAPKYRHFLLLESDLARAVFPIKTRLDCGRTPESHLLTFC